MKTEDYDYSEDEDRDPTTEHRYIFTVRQEFGQTPHVDAFYELTVPAGTTGDQAKIMKKLDPRWCQEEITQDSHALKGMELRIRFNTDFYQKICLVRTTCPISADQLDNLLQAKAKTGELMDFLDESAIK